jgi:hypothetical protein
MHTKKGQTENNSSALSAVEWLNMNTIKTLYLWMCKQCGWMSMKFTSYGEFVYMTLFVQDTFVFGTPEKHRLLSSVH